MPNLQNRKTVSTSFLSDNAHIKTIKIQFTAEFVFRVVYAKDKSNEPANFDLQQTSVEMSSAVGSANWILLAVASVLTLGSCGPFAKRLVRRQFHAYAINRTNVRYR